MDHAAMQHDISKYSNPKIKYLVYGIINTTVFFVLDWLLPYWFKGVFVADDSLQRARELDQFLKVRPYSKQVRLIQFVALLLAFSCFNVYLVPKRRCLLYNVFAGCATIVVVSSLEYARSDVPPGVRRLDMLGRRYVAIGHVICAYCLVYRRELWSLLMRELLRAMLMMTCFLLALWMLRSWVLGPAIPPVTTGSWKYRLACQAGGEWRRLTTTVGKAWNIYDIAKALVMDRLPTTLQSTWWKVQRNRWQDRYPIYRYSPLEAGQIRLLRLDPAAWWRPSTIRASLWNVHTLQLPSYEAVSYRWGDDRLTHEILLDGARLRVTKSAFDLLLARRSTWRTRSIWIDAICINQADKVEKAIQVGKMREIYHSASRVVIFLGQDWRARLAAKLVYETLDGTQDPEDGLLELMRMLSGEQAALKWHVMRDLFKNEYFSRVWILQEIALGENVQLYYGGMYIDFSTFMHFARRLVDPFGQDLSNLGAQGRLVLGSATLANLVTMLSLRRDYSSSSGDYTIRTSIEAVLFATSKFHASNPRDNVFGILGVANYQEGSLRLLPTYEDSKSVAGIYTDAVEYILFEQTQPSLHVLALAGIGYTHNRLPIPSWAPDLSEARTEIFFTDPVNLQNAFKASDSDSPRVSIGSVPGSLVLTGVMCDQILSTSTQTSYTFDTGSGTLAAMLVYGRRKAALLTAIVAFVSDMNLARFPDTDYLDDQLWLVMAAGRIHGKRPTDDKWKHAYRIWTRAVQLGATATLGQSLGDLVDNHDRVELSSEEVLITPQDLALYESAFQSCYGRRFAITKKGRLCWLPPLAEAGDMVFIPAGAQTPFVVRRKGVGHGQDGLFELVGEAYVHGLMWRGLRRRNDVKWKSITLI